MYGGLIGPAPTPATPAARTFACSDVQAAGTIHTDFERGFICAEVMTYADLKVGGQQERKLRGSWSAAGVQLGEGALARRGVCGSLGEG